MLTKNTRNHELFTIILVLILGLIVTLTQEPLVSSAKDTRDLFRKSRGIEITPSATGTPALTEVQQIAFDSFKNGTAAIYTMDINGNNLQQLGKKDCHSTDPGWSPNGRSVVFVAICDVRSQIYVTNADGANQYRLTNNEFNDLDPVWSPDSKTIVFVSDRSGRFQIYSMNVDGTDQHILISSDNYESNPAWSPDGNYIAFDAANDGDKDIHIAKADGSEVHQITTDKESFNPCWSPDGKSIAFTKGNYADGYAIYVMNADGTKQRALTPKNAEAGRPAWSPDGKLIAFSWGEQDEIVIKLMSPDGSNVRQLTSFNGNHPAWRPLS